MKKRLNFITLLIVVAIGIIIMDSEVVSLMKAAILDGIHEGQENGSEIKESGRVSNKTLILSLESIDNAMPSELLNKKNGNTMPARINRAMVKVPMETVTGLNLFWEFILAFFSFAGIIMIIYNFIRIIIAVNKSVIFEWINVKRLRRIGIGFLIMFIITAFLAVSQNSTVLEVVDIENYKIINSLYDGIVLMLGMISFLVAEIFAVGLKLREEQDLTI